VLDRVYRAVGWQRVDQICYIYNLNEETGKTKKNWYDRILRMVKNRLTEIVLNYKPGRSRNKLQEDPARIIMMDSIGDGKAMISYP
jgi:hypothetical protein